MSRFSVSMHNRQQRGPQGDASCAAENLASILGRALVVRLFVLGLIQVVVCLIMGLLLSRNRLSTC